MFDTGPDPRRAGSSRPMCSAMYYLRNHTTPAVWRQASTVVRGFPPEEPLYLQSAPHRPIGPPDVPSRQHHMPAHPPFRTGTRAVPD